MTTDAERPVPSEETPKPGLGVLLRRAQNGDRRALDGIIDELMPLVWNVARAQGLDVDTASDVVQSAWQALVENLHDIHTPEAVAAWLIKVTRRLAWRARDRIRRDGHVDPDDLAGWPAPAGDIGDSVADDEQNRCLWRNLRRLKPICQELLRIAAFVDRPNYSAIAEMLNIPRGSIGPTRLRCMAKLKKLLGEDPQWSPR